jgi:hypothetical protein
MATFKYRAFLSYSHSDTAWAKWLHRALETYRIDKDLIGRETAHGPIPKTLRPIFRDREDFSGGHILTDATAAALDASAALIVLCSAVSARRPVVNEEVRLFRSRHPDRPVIPVIIDGKTPENFPPALRYELAADGTLTDRPVTILGPDLREGGDGRNLGLAKTIAGLTGLAPDDIFRRAERARKRRNRIRIGAASVGALAIAIAAFAWTGMDSFYQRLRVQEDVNTARDVADICEHANGLNVTDEWRIAIALECVDTLTEVFSGLPEDAPMPQRVISLFEANLSILTTFESQGKLTAEQIATLRRAETLEAQLSKR